MTELRLGDRVRDNGSRVPTRVLVITAVPHPKYADCVAAKGRAGPEVRILMRRIYSDGKPRKSGFTLLARD